MAPPLVQTLAYSENPMYACPAGDKLRGTEDQPMLTKTLPLTLVFFLALSTVASADSVNSIAITGTAYDGFASSSGDFIIHGSGLSLYQSSPGGPSFIGICNLGSLCNFSFSAAGNSYCGYCSLYSSGTFGNAVAELFTGGLTFSTPAVVWNGQSVMNLPLTISGQIIGFELLNCNGGYGCTLGPQVFDLKIAGTGTGEFQMAQTGLILGVSASYTGTATPVSSVPEPISLLLMSSGIAAIGLARKRSLKIQSRSA
ncbi:MAG: PEP-CTERM sorting domain-containing protein [Candidatus Sulfotelmatobacter sp.]